MRKLQKEIIALKQCGISGMPISNLLKVAKSTVFDAIKCFKKLGDYSNCSGRGQKKICMHQNIDKKSVFQQQAPKSIMVWAAFSKTWKSPLIFIEKIVKINVEYYVANVLKSISLLLNDHYKDKNWTF